MNSVLWICQTRRPNFSEQNILTARNIDAALDEVAYEARFYCGIFVLGSTDIYFFANDDVEKDGLARFLRPCLCTS